jgi:hypothetical protein
MTPVREHDLLAMTCIAASEEGEGRWAVLADRPALERYQTLYNEERRTTLAPAWESLLRRASVAVLEREGCIVAVVKRTADTTRYATMGGTWKDPPTEDAVWPSASPPSLSVNCSATVRPSTSSPTTTTSPPSPSTAR